MGGGGRIGGMGKERKEWGKGRMGGMGGEV